MQFLRRQNNFIRLAPNKPAPCLRTSYERCISCKQFCAQRGRSAPTGALATVCRWVAHRWRRLVMLMPRRYMRAAACICRPSWIVWASATHAPHLQYAGLSMHMHLTCNMHASPYGPYTCMGLIKASPYTSYCSDVLPRFSSSSVYWPRLCARGLAHVSGTLHTSAALLDA